MSARDCALDQIWEITQDFGPDEMRALVEVARRLSMGRKCYGELRLETDPRDWAKEAGEEAMDLLVYAACRYLTQKAAT